MIKFRWQISALAIGVGLIAGLVSPRIWADDAKSCQPWLERELDFVHWSKELGTDETSFVSQAPELLPVFSRLELIARRPISVRQPRRAAIEQFNLANAMDLAADRLEQVLIDRAPGTLFPLDKRALRFVQLRAIGIRSKASHIRQLGSAGAEFGITPNYDTLERLRVSFWSTLIERMVGLFAVGVDPDFAIGSQVRVGQIDVIDLFGRGWIEVKALSFARTGEDRDKQILLQARRYVDERIEANRLLPPEKSVQRVAFVFLRPLPNQIRSRLVNIGVEVKELSVAP